MKGDLPVPALRLEELQGESLAHSPDRTPCCNAFREGPGGTQRRGTFPWLLARCGTGAGLSVSLLVGKRDALDP